ncbi:unnamed protein product [Adineta steineri]|uniref:TIR domain-containing protein n=1 Tax=Adineta steineri TaxID=433720 RepID=A0A815FT01_9BILA|nr:unnamed protein product [Adineta steineri]CAF3749107.1 unnamed protein product [Adineta steineri]
MKSSLTDTSTIGYVVEDRIQKQFLKNSKCCLYLQEHLQNLLSVSIAIIPQQVLRSQQVNGKLQKGYMIYLLNEKENQAEAQQILSDCVKNFFEGIQFHTFADNQVEEWLQDSSSKIEFLLETCSRKLRAIEKKYKQFDIDIRLTSHEFSAPHHVKDEIEFCIKELLSYSLTTTFKSIELFQDIAEVAGKRLKSIAFRSQCHIMTELRHKRQHYIIPKASSSNIQVSKSVVKQSDQFMSSLDVFNRVVLANGSIEIRTGDIALQKVNTIVISITSNGLKEGVIERAGGFEYEQTYTDETNIKFTETNGGNLRCKRILFSNWIPLTLTNDHDGLRNSVKLFVSKSIEYATRDQNCKSIAFAVCDSCINETILAQEMIAVTKHVLESKNIQLKIIFVLLPEQQALHKQFFTLLGETQNFHAQFDWPTTGKVHIMKISLFSPFPSVTKITLKAAKAEDLTKCQEKINTYLKRCITSTKSIDSNGIFSNWDQHTINAFYNYCKDRCVLPRIDPTTTELELSGPVNNILEVKQKWQFLSQLVREKVSYISKIERPNSAALCSARVETGTSIGQTKVYNIMISYCQQNARKCQGMINRFIEEGFAIWAEPVIGEQQRNVFPQIDRSDCILLCISEDYYENQACEEEARYAFQTGKQVFLVKIQNNPLIGWQRRVFEGKVFFQLFGSKNHFDLEFEKLLLDILQYTKPGFVPLLQQISGRSILGESDARKLLTAEQRQSIYDEKIGKLEKIGYIEKEEMEELNKQLESVITSIVDNETSLDRQKLSKESNWIERWLRKPRNTTKQNLPPFSLSGDINDAIFPMPEYILEALNLHVPSFSTMPTSLIKFGNVFEYDIIKRPIELPFTRDLFKIAPADNECIYEKCTSKLEISRGISQVFFDQQFAADADSQKAMNLPVLSMEILSINENKTEKHPKTKGERRKVTKDAIKKYKRPTREELDVHLKRFGQQMSENAKKFEEFCSTVTATT